MGYLFEYESFLSLKPYVAHLVWRITPNGQRSNTRVITCICINWIFFSHGYEPCKLLRSMFAKSMHSVCFNPTPMKMIMMRKDAQRCIMMITQSMSKRRIFHFLPPEAALSATAHTPFSPPRRTNQARQQNVLLFPKGLVNQELRVRKARSWYVPGISSD
jgi:hypothetical protein